MRGPLRETSGFVRKQNQEKGESVSQGPYCGFQGNGEAGQHKQFWIGQFEKFQWIWDLEVSLPICLVLGLGWISGRENSSLLCESTLPWIKELLNLHMRSVLPVTILEMNKPWEAQSLLKFVRPSKVSKHHKIRTIKNIINSIFPLVF